MVCWCEVVVGGGVRLWWLGVRLWCVGVRRWVWCGGVRVCKVLCTETRHRQQPVARCVWHLWRDGCNDSDVNCSGVEDINFVCLMLLCYYVCEANDPKMWSGICSPLISAWRWNKTVYPTCFSQLRSPRFKDVYVGAYVRM